MIRLIPLALAFISISAFAQLDIRLNPDFAMCTNDSVIIEAKVVSGTVVSSYWFVRNGSNLDTIAQNTDSIHITLPGASNSQRYTIIYLAINGLDSDLDSMIVTVNPLPEIDLDNGDFCQSVGDFRLADEVVKRPANVYNGSGQWRCLECNGNDFNDMLVDKGVGIPDYYLDVSASAYTLRNQAKDTITLEFTFRNAFGCYNKDTVDIRIWRVPTLKFNDYRELCWDDGEIDLNDMFGVNFKNGVWTVDSMGGFRNPHELGGITNGSLIDTKRSIPLASEYATPNAFNLTFTHSATGCIASIDTQLYIWPLPQPFIGSMSPEFCDVDLDIHLVGHPNSPASGIWSCSFPSAIVSDTLFSPSKIPDHLKGVPIWIYFNYQNPNTGCYNQDSTPIVVTASPEVILPQDAAFCKPLGQNNITLNVPIFTQHATGLNWTVLNINSSNPFIGAGTSQTINLNVAIDNDSTNIIYIEASTSPSGACNAAFASTFVYVHPRPDASISATPDEDTLILNTQFDLSIYNQIDSTNASFSWDFDDGNNSSVRRPSHTYNTIGFYSPSVVLTSGFGCDTTLITAVKVFDLPPEPYREIKNYPNPIDGDMQLEFPDNIKVKRIRVVGANGDTYYTSTDDSKSQTLDLRHLRPGLYVLHVETNETAYRKLFFAQ